jgi:hypothetical protein
MRLRGARQALTEAYADGFSSPGFEVVVQSGGRRDDSVICNRIVYSRIIAAADEQVRHRKYWLRYCYGHWDEKGSLEGGRYQAILAHWLATTIFEELRAIGAKRKTFPVVGRMVRSAMVDWRHVVRTGRRLLDDKQIMYGLGLTEQQRKNFKRDYMKYFNQMQGILDGVDRMALRPVAAVVFELIDDSDVDDATEEVLEQLMPKHQSSV